MKVVKLTENDLMKIVKRVMSEQETETSSPQTLKKKNYTLYKKEKMNATIYNQPMGIKTGLYALGVKDENGKYYNLTFDCREPDILRIEGRKFSSVENTELTGELRSRYCGR